MTYRLVHTHEHEEKNKTMLMTLTLNDDKMRTYEAKNTSLERYSKLNSLIAFHSNQIKSRKRNYKNH